MTITRKVVLVVILTDIILLTGLFGLIDTLTFRRLKTIETENILKDVGRVEDAVAAQVESLVSKNGDWSNWSETYEFVSDANAEYLENNQTTNSFVQLNVSGMLFFDQDDKLVHSKEVDLTTLKEIPVDPELIKQVGASSLLVHRSLDQVNTGFLEAENGVYMVSSRSILQDTGEGPSRGSLVFLRKIDEGFIEKIANTTHLQVDLFTKNFHNDEEHFDEELAGMAGTEGKTAKITSRNSIEGLLLLEDINDQPIGYWELTTDRPIYIAGLSSSRLFAIAFAIVAVILVAVIIFFLRRSILNRLQVMATSVKQIDESGNLSQSLDVKGTDEISRLATAFNNLLNRLRSTLEGDQRLQTTLETERDRARAIIESMGEGLLVLDDNFNIIRINKTAQQLLEVSEEEALGKKWYKLVEAFSEGKKIPLEERSAVKVMDSGKPITTKLEDSHHFKTVKGNMFPVVSTTTPYQEKGVRGVVIVFRDVTKELYVLEKVEKEVVERTQEAQEARARLISSINSLTIGFIMTDLKHNILLINQSAVNIFSDADPNNPESGDNIPVVNIETMTTSLGGHVELVKEINRCLKLRRTISLTDLIVGDKDVEIYISPILFEENAIGTAMLVVDVTEEKALARAKDDFLYIASHELRTPLTAIMGNANIIEQYFSSQIKSADLREMIDDMKIASLRLIDLVNDFLNVSRLEQGRITFKIEEVSIKKIAEEVITELAPTAKNGVKLVMDSKTDLIASADLFRVKEVMTNLIGNALKYTEKGKVTVAWEKSDSTIIVRVADSGRGISRENQKVLFQKFRQAGNDSITRDSTKSSGLGLYISKMLIKGMGGNIALEKSSPNKGSVFMFSLPLKK